LLWPAWKKRDLKSNEAGIKFYLIGVMSSAIMLYGMSFVVGFSGSTLFSDIQKFYADGNVPVLANLAVIFTIIGLAFQNLFSSISPMDSRYLRRCTNTCNRIF
jgi:NADH-quinone oxidoreductase subunit N